jgi:hypothetical protein
MVCCGTSNLYMSIGNVTNNDRRFTELPTARVVNVMCVDQYKEVESDKV